MNWVFINGSPRRNGNTSYALGKVKEALVTADDGAVYHLIHERVIGACTDCRSCVAGDLVCRKADGMARLYRDLETADVIVMGSPVYWSGVTGPMKNLIDRLRPYSRNKRLAKRKMVVVSTGARADVESDLIESMYRRLCEALDVELIGHVVANGSDIGDLERSGFDAGRVEKGIRLER